MGSVGKARLFQIGLRPVCRRSIVADDEHLLRAAIQQHRKAIHFRDLKHTAANREGHKRHLHRAVLAVYIDPGLVRVFEAQGCFLKGDLPPFPLGDLHCVFQSGIIRGIAHQTASEPEVGALSHIGAGIGTPFFKYNIRSDNFTVDEALRRFSDTSTACGMRAGGAGHNGA